MGKKTMSFVVPIVMAVAMPYVATWAAGGSTTLMATGGGAGLGVTGGSGALLTGAAAETAVASLGFMDSALLYASNVGMGQSLLTGAAMGYLGGMQEEPVAPDYSNMFAQQQAGLTQQQSFGRKATGELEQMLEFGSDYEKNQAYDELQRRGEDTQRLDDLSTRRGRTEERQGEIDEYIDRNAPPSEDELNILRASLVSQEEDKLDSDIEAERIRAKQVMARKGLGSSNALSQLNARLEDVRAKGKLAIRNDVDSRVVNYAKGISSLQSEGLNRLMSASSMEEATSRYDLGMQDSERKLQEGLRQSSIASQNTMALEKFRAEVTGQNQAYEKAMESQNNTAMLGLGALGIAAPRIWPTAAEQAALTPSKGGVTQNFYGVGSGE